MDISFLQLPSHMCRCQYCVLGNFFDILIDLQQPVLHQAAEVLREEREGGDEQTAAQDHHRFIVNNM